MVLRNLTMPDHRYKYSRRNIFEDVLLDNTIRNEFEKSKLFPAFSSHHSGYQNTMIYSRKKFNVVFLIALTITSLSGCASQPLINPSETKTFRLAIIGFKITAPIKKLSSIQDTSDEDLTEVDEKQLLSDQFKKIEELATNDLKSHLEKTGFFDVVLIPDGFSGTQRGEKPTDAQVDAIAKEFRADMIFYGQIPWYGKTRLLYPLLFTAGDIASETLVFGLLTNWNSRLLLVNVGFELLTNIPLWFGGAYLFGVAFRPVSVDGHVIYAKNDKSDWDDAVERVVSKKYLIAYPESERARKEIQLESSLKSSIEGLSNSMTGQNSSEGHMGTVGLLLGNASIINGKNNTSRFSGGFAADFNLQNYWRAGVQFGVTAPDSKGESLANFDIAVKYVDNDWSVGLLLGLGMNLKTTNNSDISEKSYLNYGLVAGYDWKIAKTDLSLGPQINIIRSEGFGGLTQLDALMVVKYGFL